MNEDVESLWLRSTPSLPPPPEGVRKLFCDKTFLHLIIIIVLSPRDLCCAVGHLRSAWLL